MANVKTVETDQNVEAFLNQLADEKKRKDSFVLLDLIKQVTGMQPRLWGDSIIGFGKYHYKYASGREGNAPLIGFSPRKQNLVLYIMPGFEEYEALLKKLGKHKTGKVCVYINKIEDIDLAVLKALVERSVDHMRKTNP